MKPWPAERARSLRALMMMIPWLLAKEPLEPTLEDWLRYQARVDNAPWN